MSATKARTILAIGENGARLERDEYVPEDHDVRLDDLSRAELIRGAKVRFPHLDGRRWMQKSNDEIIQAIKTGEPGGDGKSEQGENDGDKQGDEMPTPKQAAYWRALNTENNEGHGLSKPDAEEATERLEKTLKTDGKWTKQELTDRISELVDKRGKGGKGKGKEDDQSKSDGTIDQAVQYIARKVAQSIQEQSKGLLDEDRVRVIAREEATKLVDGLPGRTVTIEFREGREAQQLPDNHHEMLPLLIQVLGAGHHVFLVGPAGSGKSTLAYQAADALQLNFGAISFGPTTPTSKLFGYMNATGQYVTTEYRKCFDESLEGGIFLGDELDNGHPGLTAELNQSLANGHGAFADSMVGRHPDFRFVATGNTFGRGPDRLFVGRNILDAATLDRFTILEVPVDERLERSLARAYADGADPKTVTAINAWIDYVQACRKKVDDQRLPVVVSPRSTIGGAQLLRAGVDRKTVENIRLFAGISSELRAKVAA